MNILFAERYFILSCSVFAFLIGSVAFSSPQGSDQRYTAEQSASSAEGIPDSYTVDLVATASFGVDMNDAGDVIGTSYLDTGCGSTCLPPLETVVWKDGVRIVLPSVPGLLDIYLTGINNQGWICGSAGYIYTTTHAVVWKPVGDSYVAIDLGNLPGKTISTATGIDDLGRVVGWSTTQNFPPSGAPFLWTEAGGMVDLSALGFPNEQPLGISPGGTVATYGLWYRLDDPGSVTALPAAPSGFSVENSGVGINDAGDQARFLVTTGGQNLVYPFRYHHEGTWQQVSFLPTGHLSSYGIGSINDAGDLTATVQGIGMIAYGPDGLAQSVATLVSPAYGGSPITAIGPLNASGEILARMIIGQSGQRLVRLVPGEPCVTSCIRVGGIQMKGKGPAYCDQGNVQVKAKVTVTDEAGNRLSGVTVTGHFFDDYWLDETVVAQTNTNGQAFFTHIGPPCIGAIAFLVTDATSVPARTLDRTTGILTNYVIPLPGGEVLDFDGVSPTEDDPALVIDIPRDFALSQNYPNPFNPTTTISYQLPVDAHVTLIVSDVLGREMATLVNGQEEAGYKSVTFDGRRLASGIYIYRMTAGSFVETKRMMLLK
jgi:probable HAF family extracellular repeat protein